jgi:hypothetical protein
MNSKTEVDVVDLGVLSPGEVQQQQLFSGEVGKKKWAHNLLSPCVSVTLDVPVRGPQDSQLVENDSITIA